MAISESGQREKFKKGDFIGQKYEVYDVLGEGGFGIVYLAYSNETKTAYALKTFRDEYLKDMTTIERFRREAQVWIDLERHPYLVRASFVDKLSGRLYIAMEPIFADEPGMNTLEGYLRRRPPDLAQSLKWAIQFSHGMEYAYSKGVKAHRDIKPANIMIDQNKAVKISDFGLAGVLPESSASEQEMVAENIGNNSSMQTVVGTSIGTPEYMSPEQFSDLASCDERSDIYSFGIVLYQMASGGRLPFFIDNPMYRWTALRHFHQGEPVPKLKSPLYPIIQRCLEKEPEKRYQTFKELRADLEPLLNRETGEIVRLPESKEMETWECNNKGISFKHLGKYEAALSCYDRAIEINQGNFGAWNNKGTCLCNLGRYEEAKACYETALRINPDNEKAWHNKGALYLSLLKYDDAIDCFNKALNINPMLSIAYFNKGLCLIEIEEDEDAIHCFNQALEIDQNNLKIISEKEKCCQKLGRYDEALRCANIILSVEPTDDATLTNKGQTLAMLERYDEALQCFEKAREMNPNNNSAWSNTGNIYLLKGKYRDALNCYDRALTINEQDEIAWNNKGTALDYLGNYHEAIACYNKAIELKPSSPDPWYGKGNTLKRLGMYEESLLCYDKVIEINPLNAAAWDGKGVSLDILERPKEAITYYDRAIELSPHSPSPWYNKGSALMKLENYKVALLCFESSIECSPNCAETWNMKGICLENLRRFAEADTCFGKALRINPKYDKARHNRARVVDILQKGEQIAQAIRELKIAEIEHNKQKLHADAIKRLIQLYLDSGDKQKALYYCDMLIKTTNYITDFGNKAIVMSYFGDYSGAVGLLTDILKEWPHVDSLWYVLSNIHEQHKNYSEAVKAAMKCREILGRSQNPGRQNLMDVEQKIKVLQRHLKK